MSTTVGQCNSRMSIEAVEKWRCRWCGKARKGQFVNYKAERCVENAKLKEFSQEFIGNFN